MPIFEYRCAACRRKFNILVGVVAGDDTVSCPKCGGTEVSKLISRFSRGRSGKDAFDTVPEPSDPNDPRALREWMKNMGDEMGQDFEQEYDEIMSEEGGEADSGES